jgi:DNA recombination protein RmuC
LEQVRARLEEERLSRAAAQARMEEQSRNIEEQRRRLADDEKKLREVFTALAADSLKNSGDQFLKQAEERVKPLREALERYERHVKELEQARQTAYGGLREQLGKIETTHSKLQRETGSLVAALRSPQVRGQWGEMTLQRVVEVAGMSALCDFDVQSTADTDAGRQRPDLIVRLPGGRQVVVDAKAPLNSYLDAAAADDADVRRARLMDHARSVRKHVDALAARAYGASSAESAEFVVMYLPGEAFFSAAVMHDASLIDDAASRGVVLASPTTLIALLRAVAYGWQQHRMAQNAVRIAEAGRELFERVAKFAEHLERVGEGLNRAGEAYNAAVRSWQTRIAPSGRRLTELGAVPENRELPSLESVDAAAEGSRNL